jgi:hypothetical protein
VAAVSVDHISPELVLVCPELRATAIAALPERDPDAWLVRNPSPRTTSLEYTPLPSVAEQIETVHERPTPLPLAILAYTVGRALTVAVEAAAALGVVTAFCVIAAAVHS